VEIVKILLGEGGSIKKVARTSKHIIMFAFAISQLNSTLVYILHWYYCSFMHAWYCLYAYTYFDPRELL